MQDANGVNGSDPLSGVVTAQRLIDAIAADRRPELRLYRDRADHREHAPAASRAATSATAILYNPDRVAYVDGSAQLIDRTRPSAGSRNPLVADFTFNGETVRLVNVHFTSRLGSDPAVRRQPAAGQRRRRRAAPPRPTAVRAYVNDSLATDPSLQLGVLGDFNGFYFEDSVDRARGGRRAHQPPPPATPEEERYSYLFDGNLAGDRPYAGHRRAARPAPRSTRSTSMPSSRSPCRAAPTTTRSSAASSSRRPNEAPTDLVIDDAAVDENAPAGTLVGTLSADDIDDDVLAYSLVDDAGGLFELDAATGALTTTGAARFRGAVELHHHRRRDRSGRPRASSATSTISVADVNEAPVAADDAVAVDEDATTPNLWSQLLGNDSDPDAGASPVDRSRSTRPARSAASSSTPATQTLRYVADDDSFDAARCPARPRPTASPTP